MCGVNSFGLPSCAQLVHRAKSTYFELSERYKIRNMLFGNVTQLSRVYLLIDGSYYYDIKKKKKKHKTN